MACAQKFKTHVTVGNVTVGTGTKEYLTADEFRRTVRRNFGIMKEEWVKKYFQAFDRNHRQAGRVVQQYCILCGEICKYIAVFGANYVPLSLHKTKKRNVYVVFIVLAHFGRPEQIERRKCYKWP